MSEARDKTNLHLGTLFRVSLFRHEATWIRSQQCTPKERVYDIPPDLADPHSTRLHQIARNLPQYFAALGATFGALSTGATLGWTAPVMVKLTGNSTGGYDFPVNVVQGDWIASVVNLGAAFVCFPIGVVMDAIGRKRTMLLLTIPFVLGWFLITFGTSSNWLIAGRFITGMAGGAFCVTAPAYTSEISSSRIRGTLGSFFQLMLTIGILLAFTVGGTTSIFVFNILCASVPVLFCLIFIFMPESPRYLVMKGRYDDARQSLIKLRGHEYDVEHELESLIKQTEEDKAKRRIRSYRALLTSKIALKIILICYTLMFLQQFSGVNAVVFNASKIMADAGAVVAPIVMTIIIGMVQVIATFFCSMLVDRVGRRILLLYSASNMCLNAIALGLYFFLQKTHGKQSEMMRDTSWVPILCISLYVIAFSLGFGPIPWMMACELCTMDIKAFVASTAGTLSWLLSFAVTTTFYSMNEALGVSQVFWIYAGIMFFGFIFTLLVIPETKGKTTEEIQGLLGAPARPRHRKTCQDKTETCDE